MASGNGISGLLNFKIFWGACPQTPLETGVTGAPLACPPRTQISSYGHDYEVDAICQCASERERKNAGFLWTLTLFWRACADNGQSYAAGGLIWCSEQCSAGAILDWWQTRLRASGKIRGGDGGSDHPLSPPRNFITSPQSPICHQYKMAPAVNGLAVHRLDCDRELRGPTRELQEISVTKTRWAPRYSMIHRM